MTAIKGYVVLTQVLSGWELVWRTTSEESNGEDFPQVFETERAAQLEILDDLQSDIEQFKDREREYEEISWPDSEYTVAKIVIYEDGEMMVYQGDDDAPQPVFITSLDTWRKEL